MRDKLSVWFHFNSLNQDEQQHQQQQYHHEFMATNYKEKKKKNEMLRTSDRTWSANNDIPNELN